MTTRFINSGITDPICEPVINYDGRGQPCPFPVHAIPKLSISGFDGGNSALLIWDLKGWPFGFLETSVDLKNWEEVAQIPPIGSRIEPTVEPRRFWRIRVNG